VLRQQLEGWPQEELAALRHAMLDSRRPVSVQLLGQELLTLLPNGETAVIDPPGAP
jgi:hypothetical protein